LSQLDSPFQRGQGYASHVVTVDGRENHRRRLVDVDAMAGIAFAAINTAGVSCSSAAGIVTRTLGSIAPGAFQDLVFAFDALIAGVHSNTGRITGVALDGNSANDTATWTLTINK
jgi:hypothetical protein